jgi:diguanylate cyclase (GGDEF)-like protein/PAS domain S-box-containing protein
MGKAVLHQKKLFSAILDHVSDGIVAVDPDMSVIFMNSAAVRMSGWAENEAQGKLIRQVFNLIDPHSLVPLLPAGLPQDDRPRFFQSAIFKSSTGVKLIVDGCVTQIPSANRTPPGYVVVFRDISEVKKLSAVIDHQAYHDSLTSLSNREGFTLQMEELLDGLKRDGREHTLLELDIDGFRMVNDAGGIKAGDEILRQMAELIRSQVQRNDLAARLSGDVFTLVLRNCVIRDAVQVAQRLQGAVRGHEFTHQDRVYPLTVSIGLLPLTGEDEDVHRVLTTAHHACVLAKQAGGDRFMVIEPPSSAPQPPSGG